MARAQIVGNKLVVEFDIGGTVSNKDGEAVITKKGRVLCDSVKRGCAFKLNGATYHLGGYVTKDTEAPDMAEGVVDA